nr:uncharacterized protein LOC120968958 [Aegilops tauschii subsp. strangulata]
MGRGCGFLKSMAASPRPGDAGSLVPASAVARSPAPVAGQELETEGRRRTRPARSWGRRGGGGFGRPGAVDGREAADPVKIGSEEGRRSGIEGRSGEEGGWVGSGSGDQIGLRPQCPAAHLTVGVPLAPLVVSGAASTPSLASPSSTLIVDPGTTSTPPRTVVAERRSSEPSTVAAVILISPPRAASPSLTAPRPYNAGEATGLLSPLSLSPAPSTRALMAAASSSARARPRRPARARHLLAPAASWPRGLASTTCCLPARRPLHPTLAAASSPRRWHVCPHTPVPCCDALSLAPRFPPVLVCCGG